MIVYHLCVIYTRKKLYVYWIYSNFFKHFSNPKQMRYIFSFGKEGIMSKELRISTCFGENASAIDVFDWTIQLFVNQYGLERVIEADKNTSQTESNIIISTARCDVDYPSNNPRQSQKARRVRHPDGEYYISTNHAPDRKKELLERIICYLGDSTNVRVIP